MYSTIPAFAARSASELRSSKAECGSSKTAISAPSTSCGSSTSSTTCMNHLMFIFGNIMSIHASGRKSPLPHAKRHFASTASPGTISMELPVKTLGQLLDTKDSQQKSLKNASPNAHVLNSASAASADALIRQNEHQSKYKDALKSLENIYANLNILPKRHQILAIFEAAASAADVPFIQSLLRTMASQFRIKVDHQLLGLYMKALFQFGDSAAAMAVLDEMRRAEDRNMRPTAQTYGIVLKSIKESGLSLQDVQAWLKLDDALGRDPSSWEALIEHRAKEEDPDGGFELLHFALRHDIPLHSSAYTCLIQRYSADHRYQDAENVISMMIANVPRLTRTSCAVLVDYYFNKKDEQKGQEWLAKLNFECSTSSLAPNPASIPMIIHTFVKYGTKTDLESFWAQCKRLSPSLVSIAGYTAIVYAFYKFRDRQTAADIVLQVINAAETNRLEIDRKFCSIVLSCIVEPSVAVAFSRLKSRLSDDNKRTVSQEAFAAYAKTDPDFQAYLMKMHPQSRRWLVLDDADARRVLTPVEVQKFSSWYQLAYRNYIKSRS